ncbi:MAG: tubulin-like doman-containing protein [Muribaculaceae bacterium]|nr:tubulin-like doman-containing protein [Muribaculaceae bacterium]
MPKLYIFAIGGTGSRVLRALTMLMASGVKINTSEIVPIIIDPDVACGDKTDTVNLMNQYSRLYDTQAQDGNRKVEAFSTKITNLGFPTDYVMPMGGKTNSSFGDYMQFGSLSDENRALVNMLFSDENQQTDMTIGFTGNPNIGSVVLNQFSESEEFTLFGNSFAPGDKIFIVSSIFGGTGASGFPLLLKNLRHINPSQQIPNAAAIQNAEIGAITVLPYFNVESDNKSVISSDTFISKTKSALSYYENNLNGLNVLYYIGDRERGQQENNEGGAEQRNEAHFIELAAALAIVDFANHSYPTSQTTCYKEFGIQDNINDITLRNLGSVTYTQLARPLTEFTLFSKYFHEKLPESMSQQWISDYSTLIGSPIYDDISQLTSSFIRWEREMESNHHARRFTPFILDRRPSDVFGLAKGIPTASAFGVSASNWDLFNHYLNKGEQSRLANQHGKNSEGKFLAHLLLGTQKVVSKKIKF